MVVSVQGRSPIAAWTWVTASLAFGREQLGLRVSVRGDGAEGSIVFMALAVSAYRS